MDSCFRTRQITVPLSFWDVALHATSLPDCSLAGDEMADLPGKWKPQCTSHLFQMLVLPRALEDEKGS